MLQFPSFYNNQTRRQVKRYGLIGSEPDKKRSLSLTDIDAHATFAKRSQNSTSGF